MSQTKLLPCRWRGEPAGDRFACSSPKLIALLGVTAEHCARCYCRDHESVPRAVRPQIQVGLPLLPACRHEGSVVEHGQSDSCHVRWCLHPTADRDHCTRGPNAGSVASCLTCPDYDLPGRRHLLYHLLPVAGNGTWQRNLDQLKARLHLFDGRKVIAVCTVNQQFTDTNTGRGTFRVDPPEAVAEYLAGTGCEILTVPNDPHLREIVTWRPLWERLQEFAESDDVAFYAQGKGVTQPWNPGVSVHPWTQLMYATLLDYWPVVARTLAAHPIAGSFKKVGSGFQGSRSAWHYSGSFFWIRLREAFAHNRVDRIDRMWWGNEAWPGLHWPAHEAGCVFHDGRVPTLDLYSPDYLNRVVLPAFRSWAAVNSTRRTRPCST